MLSRHKVAALPAVAIATLLCDKAQCLCMPHAACHLSPMCCRACQSQPFLEEPRPRKGMHRQSQQLFQLSMTSVSQSLELLQLPVHRHQDFQPPSGHIASAIDNDFGSVDDLKSKFNAAAAGIQVCLLQTPSKVHSLLLDHISQTCHPCYCPHQQARTCCCPYRS